MRRDRRAKQTALPLPEPAARELASEYGANMAREGAMTLLIQQRNARAGQLGYVLRALRCSRPLAATAIGAATGLVAPVDISGL